MRRRKSGQEGEIAEDTAQGGLFKLNARASSITGGRSEATEIPSRGGLRNRRRKRLACGRWEGHAVSGVIKTSRKKRDAKKFRRYVKRQ